MFFSSSTFVQTLGQGRDRNRVAVAVATNSQLSGHQVIVYIWSEISVHLEKLMVSGDYP
jgi:hypothetical protein